jgi:cytochrome c-type biogenesis protein CcmF
MIPEIGQFALILALALALTLAILPMWGVYRNNQAWMSLAPGITAGVFVFVAISFGCLVAAFLNDNFSVDYVARNSNSKLPTIYKVSAVWGAHEGSFLLWVLVMSGWTLAVSTLSRSLTLDMRARVLAIMGLLNVGFLLFLLITSNPFLRSLPVFPADGNDLNPLLQDFGLIVHPPLLYMGYVGFSVPFAFAIATLLTGQLDSAWARWSRPWTNTAWAFLTIGITLGSWWAYYELGWGGWWFWDAVENASFLPWLVGTALIHSLAATEKRGVFKTWTVLLAIFAFSLSLLGAFLVRSGVLTSVHAFAVDPERGLFILAFLVLVIGGSFTLFAIKVANIKSTAGFDFTSRESLLLMNNMLLVVAAAAVLLGTLYPLGYEAFTGGKKISVGPPYFNTIFVPVVLLLFAFMALGPFSRWKRTPAEVYRKSQLPLMAMSAVTSLLFSIFYGDSFSFWVPICVFLASWLFFGLVLDAYQQVRNKTGGERIRALFKQTPSYYGMWLGHLGIAVSIIGVCMVSIYSDERDVRMSPGDTVTMGAYEFRLLGVKRESGPNYIADRGDIEVTRNGEYLLNLNPEKRHYLVKGNVMTEADIDPGIFRDLYVALGEPVGNSGAWAVRVHYKPFVRWVWLGGVLAMFAGLITVFDRRYRSVRAKQEHGASIELNAEASQA